MLRPEEVNFGRGGRDRRAEGEAGLSTTPLSLPLSLCVFVFGTRTVSATVRVFEGGGRGRLAGDGRPGLSLMALIATAGEQSRTDARGRPRVGEPACHGMSVQADPAIFLGDCYCWW